MRRDKIMNFIGKWMKLQKNIGGTPGSEIQILSAVSQMRILVSKR